MKKNCYGPDPPFPTTRINLHPRSQLGLEVSEEKKRGRRSGSWVYVFLKSWCWPKGAQALSKLWESKRGGKYMSR